MSTNIVVRKFGGTSVQDAKALSSVRNICKDAPDVAQVVVLSATAGTTDTLFKLARAAGAGALGEMNVLLERLRTNHIGILQDAGVASHESIDAVLHDLARYANGVALLGECTSQSIDTMASFGEMLSTKIFVAMCTAAGLNATWFDARTVMRTDTRFTSASPQFDLIEPLAEKLLRPLLIPGTIVVTQGYIGETEDGRTTTLGRGGSDYSAAILGAVLGASEIQIWTDVSGVYSADPRQIPEARPIPHLSFNEVRELALYGAKVLHPDTISPAIERMIPVRILNTFRPDDEGTVITSSQPTDAAIHAVTVLRNCLSVLVHTKTTKTDTLEKLAGGCVLHMSSLDSHLFVVRLASDNALVDLEVLLAGTPNTTRNVAVVAACGPGVATAQTLARMADALPAPSGAITIMTGTNPLSAFVVCDEALVNATLTALHSLSVSLASSSRS